MIPQLILAEIHYYLIDMYRVKHISKIFQQNVKTYKKLVHINLGNRSHNANTDYCNKVTVNV